MSAAGLGLASVWLLSAAPLFLPWQAGWDRDLSLGALALLPWLVWASLPRGEVERPGIDALAPCLAAPLAVLGVGLDRARGLGWGEALVACGGAAFLALLYAWSASRCARTSRGRRVYAVGWFALIAGAPALARTLESVSGALSGPPPAWLAVCARPSPFSWWQSHLHARGPGPALPWAALGLALLLVVLAGREGKERA
jgi:hypothetical protein